jgi:acyl carrier protein
MVKSLIDDVKAIIVTIVGSDLSTENLDNDFQLAGNVLDSMAVTNLILALEEYFGITFEDDDLSAEDFETIYTISKLVEKKVNF